MSKFLWIGLAGALGTWTRYLVTVGAARLLGESFPYGTLFVNLAGCFLIAAVMQVSVQAESISPTLRLALTTGFLGGLTTYSTFNHDTTRLVQGGERFAGIVNFAATTIGCIAAGLLGVLAARRWFA